MVPVLFWLFESLIVEPSYLAPGWTIPVCDVSSQDAFYCSSVKVDQTLALEFSLPKFPQEVEPLLCFLGMPKICSQWWLFSVQCEQEWAEHTALGASSAEHNSDCQSELSGVCLWGRTIFSCRVLNSSPDCWVFKSASRWDCAERWSEVSKQYPDVAVLILQVCEDIVKGSRYNMLCGSVGSDSILVRVQADRNFVSDVLEKQFLETLPQNGGDSHRVVVIKTRHRWLFRYRNDDSCLEEATVFCESDITWKWW